MKKMSILLIVGIMLLTSCGTKNSETETTTQVEQTAEVIKKTSTLFQSVQKMGEPYQHFFTKSGENGPVGLSGLDESGVLHELNTENAYIYQTEEQQIYQIVKKDISTALGYEVEPIAVQGDTLIVFKREAVATSITSELKIVNQEKVLVFTASSIKSVDYDGTDIYISLGVVGQSDGVNIHAIKIDEKGEKIDLGEVAYLPPRGASMQPLFGYLRVSGKQYFIGLNDIYQIENNKTSKIDVTIQAESPIMSHVISHGDRIYALRLGEQNTRVLCVWDADWNVIEKIDVGVFPTYEYADTGMRHSLYIKDDILYSVGGIYAEETVKVSSLAYDIKLKKIVGGSEFEIDYSETNII